jgi:hypothetical protein
VASRRTTGRWAWAILSASWTHARTSESQDTNSTQHKVFQSKSGSTLLEINNGQSVKEQRGGLGMSTTKNPVTGRQIVDVSNTSTEY